MLCVPDAVFPGIHIDTKTEGVAAGGTGTLSAAVTELLAGCGSTRL